VQAFIAAVAVRLLAVVAGVSSVPYLATPATPLPLGGRGRLQ
jgi:hypothetical protein